MRQALTVIAVWLAGSSLLAIVLTAQEGLHFAWAFRTSGVQCGILVVLMLLVWQLLPHLERTPVMLRVAAHLVIAAIVVVGWELAFEAVLAALAGTEVASIRREVSGYWRWLQACMMYGVVLAGFVVVRTNRQLRTEERRAGELRLLMRESELRALRAQLRPHFLFNALNSIYSLIPDRPEQAAHMVALLSDLMRETLELTDRKLVTLGEELGLVRKYLEIESVRFGDRLTTHVEGEPQLDLALVPPFLLQPLVENAVHHGISPRVEPGVVMVEARQSGDALELIVRDDGVGFNTNCSGAVSGIEPELERSGTGSGLRITRSRLVAQYGHRAVMTVDSQGGVGESDETVSRPGTSVSVRLPLDLGAGSD